MCSSDLRQVHLLHLGVYPLYLYINQTDFSWAPWNVVSSEDRKLAAKEILGKSIEYIKRNVERIRQKREYEKTWKAPSFNAKKTVEDFDLSKKLEKDRFI